MELKKTILVNKTPFEMRANLIHKEPAQLDKWLKMDLYWLMNQNKDQDQAFYLHDGPPYANGSIHAGHSLNRILKDYIIRFKNLQGYYTPFVLGWDTHGLPIENAVTKSGVNRKELAPSVFREKCFEYALKQVGIQKEQILRLGIVGDYKNPYLTLNPDYEQKQIAIFADLALKGLIYKGLKPVYWSPSSETALAEAEIEYQDVISDAIYVAFNLASRTDLLPSMTKFVIWTTTPWTLPANLAIAVNPTYTYVLVRTDKGDLLLLKDLFVDVLTKIGIKEYALIQEIKGSELENLEVQHPFYDRLSRVILGDHVTKESGTGLVHTAPGHGTDDYLVSKKYGILPYCPVDERGYLTTEAGPRLAGQFYEKANQTVLEMLKEHHALLFQEQITHSYPHDWRTHKPIIYRATPQWFCSINPLKDALLDAVNRVKWNPTSGQVRMTNMIIGRDDWTISRQRLWGVPLPIIYDQNHEAIIDEELFRVIIEEVGNHGSNVWYQKSIAELFTDSLKKRFPLYSQFTKEKDIMDVWFDSGSSFASVMKEKVADLYFEGNDQYRGWFNSSLILSVATRGISPYKAVLSHGFICDENGKKMSKSSGNSIDPIKVCNESGGDILRLWAGLVDYKEDAKLGKGALATSEEIYKKIRNTLRFLLASLNNGDFGTFSPSLDQVEGLDFIDQLMIVRFKEVKNRYLKAFNEYDFIAAISELMQFVSFDLSSVYLDIIKDILYCDSYQSLRRRQVQNVCYKIVKELMIMLTPILPYTMDEIKDFIPDYHLASTQLDQMPQQSELTDLEQVLLDEYRSFIDLRSRVLKGIELLRQGKTIGSSLETRVYLTLGDSGLSRKLDLLDRVELSRLFITSDLVLVVKDHEEILVTRHEGDKCPRCWNYKDELFTAPQEVLLTDKDGNKEIVKLCHRCLETLKRDY